MTNKCRRSGRGPLPNFYWVKVGGTTSDRFRKNFPLTMLLFGQFLANASASKLGGSIWETRSATRVFCLGRRLPDSVLGTCHSSYPLAVPVLRLIADTRAIIRAMLLSITTTAVPATDLGYLLHKNPGRVHGFDLSFGHATVFYPEASPDRCTVCLLLEVDPIGLVRRKSGPAADGGWWALALAEGWNVDVFTGVPMSTAWTLTAQWSQLESLGHRVRVLPQLQDVDDFDDALAVAALVPESNFARVISELGTAA